MIVLDLNYAKKIGLPGYSSHQYSITLRAEIADLSQVSAKSQELHALMQSCVDREIQCTGFLPGEVSTNGNGRSNGNGHNNGHQRQIRPASDDNWKCSIKQKELILRITDENQLDKNMVEKLAQDRFSCGVRFLNKLQASGLIEELIEKYPSKPGRSK